MRYQLVLQFPSDSTSDLEALLALEQRSAAMLSGTAHIDGHDVGSGQANIFVPTDNPTGTFAKILPVLMKSAMSVRFERRIAKPRAEITPFFGRMAFVASSRSNE